MFQNEFEYAFEQLKQYYLDDYSIDDLKVINEYFGRDIAAAIYRGKLTYEQKEKMKKIFLQTAKDFPNKKAAEAVIKAIKKEI